MGRGVIGIAVVVVGLFGIYPPAFVGEVVAFAFGLAASSFFPTIVLRIFSTRVGTVPAISGMICGITFTEGYITASVFYGMSPWTFGVLDQGLSPQGAGAVGMVLNFVVTFALAPLCAIPDKKIQRMVDSLREPEGIGPATDIESAAEE